MMVRVAEGRVGDWQSSTLSDLQVHMRVSRSALCCANQTARISLPELGEDFYKDSICPCQAAVSHRSS